MYLSKEILSVINVVTVWFLIKFQCSQAKLSGYVDDLFKLTEYGVAFPRFFSHRLQVPLGTLCLLRIRVHSIHTYLTSSTTFRIDCCFGYVSEKDAFVPLPIGIQSIVPLVQRKPLNCFMPLIL